MEQRLVEQMIVQGLPQVRSLARMMRGRVPRADLDSLFSNGELALWQAAQDWQDDHAGNEGFPRFAALCERRAMVDGMRHWFGRRFTRYATTSLDAPLPGGGSRGDLLADRRANVEQAVEDRERIAGWVEANEAERERLVDEARPRRPLTEIEVGVLQAAAEGETIEQTAARVFKSPDTIKNQRMSAMAKLDARGITNAVWLAMRRGIVT